MTEKVPKKSRSPQDAPNAEGGAFAGDLTAKWKLNVAMAIFVVLTSARYISTKLIDSIEVTDAEGNTTSFKHPVIQSIAGYVGEFIVVFFLWLYYRKHEPEQVQPSQISVFSMALPACCDFFENMSLIFGVTQIFPSLVSMSRALVLPITALLSKLLIKKVFSWKMLLALSLVLFGMGLATFVQFEGEMSSDEFTFTTVGIFLLCLSAFIQALEIIIENRLFQIDPDLSAFYLQSAVASWKMIFSCALLPFCHLIAVPDEYVTGGRFESVGLALEVLFANSNLVWLFLIMMASNGLHAVVGMAIIKEESAMQRQTVMMLVTPSVWVFFMLYQGEAHEDFNWKQLLGMLILVAGTIWYIKSDRDSGEELALEEFIKRNELQFKEGTEENSLLLEEDRIESIEETQPIDEELLQGRKRNALKSQKAKQSDQEGNSTEPELSN